MRENATGYEVNKLALGQPTLFSPAAQYPRSRGTFKYKQEVNFKIELNFYIVVINIVYMTLHYHLYVIDLSQDILKPI